MSRLTLYRVTVFADPSLHGASSVLVPASDVGEALELGIAALTRELGGRAPRSVLCTNLTHGRREATHGATGNPTAELSRPTASDATRVAGTRFAEDVCDLARREKAGAL